MSRRETDDDYERVIVHPCDGWRIIECKDSIQWVLQRRDGSRGGRARWTGRSYHRSRTALFAVCRTLCPKVSDSAIEDIWSLPEVFGEEASAVRSDAQ